MPTLTLAQYYQSQIDEIAADKLMNDACKQALIRSLAYEALKFCDPEELKIFFID